MATILPFKMQRTHSWESLTNHSRVLVVELDGFRDLLLGFVFPFAWYYATFLYFGNHYRRDPRERAGLAASAIAALICTVILLITAIVLAFCRL